MTHQPIVQVPSYLHDPQAVLDYSVDWERWLATSETITNVVWTVPSPLTKGAEAATDSRATVWISGGIVGVEARVTCHITTSQGRQDDRSFDLVVRHR